MLFQNENLEEEEEKKHPAEKKKSDLSNKNDDLSLGVAQIVITAATPMDEVNRLFPGVEESQTQQSKSQEQRQLQETRNEKIDENKG